MCFPQKIREEAEELLETLDGVTPIHGRFYELSSNFQKLMGNHADYYRDALRFLGCIKLEDIPSKYRNTSYWFWFIMKMPYWCGNVQFGRKEI